ncbi:hypothetical protein [Streptomyces avermitilis]|uniref:hypothetical protein n=1 Tax=Streptomyces avermitilis TaxID=33903 RepID=UPI0037FE4D28
MALPPLATTAQLAAWMQTTEDALPDGASLVLTVASDIVRKEARQHFTRGTSTVTLYPSFDGKYYVSMLPQRPVVSVATVVADGVPLADSDWKLRRDALRFPRYVDEVKVLFTHGYSETPGDVLGVLLTACARVLNNPNDLRQETAGSLSVTYAAETIGASLSEKDKDLLRRYRRGVAVVTTE